MTTTGGNSTTKTNYFAELSKIDCSEHVQKKGQFSYLSWPWAIKTLREHHPEATWEVIRFDGLPYQHTELGYFVETSVTVEGVTLNHIHPILDNKNRPIQKPNSFDVNTSIMRCLVKNLALHGIGLYIYAGEDLPADQEYTQEQYKEFHRLLEEGDPLAFVAFMSNLSVNTQTALYNSFEQGSKVEGKKKADNLNSTGHDLLTKYVDDLSEAAANNDTGQIVETAEELTNDAARQLVWLRLSAETRAIIKDAMKKVA